jgi:ferrous iron transport protein A
MSGASVPVRPTICDSDQNGRILNPDQYGRSFRLLPFRRQQGVRQVSVLTDLRIGETATLLALDLPESVQNFLMHMGFVPDAQVTALRKAPAGDPTVYGIDGMEIALRRETAESIHVRSNVGSSQAEIDAELKKIAARSDPEAQAEIHEFAGATR